MKFKKASTFFFLVTFSLTAFSQIKATDEWKYEPILSAIPQGGYVWQGLNTFSVGLRLFTLQKVHENISLMGNVIFFNQKKITYAAPELKLRYFKPIEKRSIAPIVSVSYWKSKVKGTKQQILTPELGISYLSYWNLTYGYNFPLSGSALDIFSSHRLSILLTVF